MTPDEIQKMVWLQEEVKASSVLIDELNDKCRKLEVQQAKDVCPECQNINPTYHHTDGAGNWQPCPTCQGKDRKDERRKGIFNAIESARFTMEHTTLTGTDIKATNVEPCEATEAVLRFLEEERNEYDSNGYYRGYQKGL